MIILHGDNIVASRKRLIELKNNFNGEIINFNENRIDFTLLKQSLESKSLLFNDRLVIIENLFSSTSFKDKEKIVDYLKQNLSSNIIIWEKKKIDGRRITSFSKQKIERFDLSTNLFKFLESIKPKNQIQMLFLFHQCLINDPPEMIFYLLIRQIRMLLIAKDLGVKGLESLADWQKYKLIRQSKEFKIIDLINFHRQLLKIDFGQKTGASPFSLESQLDLLLSSL